MAREPCIACGYETMVGSPYYPGRCHVVRPDGTPVYLCKECAELCRTGQLAGLDEADLLQFREKLPATGILAPAGR
jgi:hypothetical protein